MKKILALAAAAALTAGVSAFAANPFSDVSTDDWAYQAVSDLSDQGVVEGYPDGTFKGERNITRYELAQIIARLMAKEDQLNAEQRATLDKLAGEYADELANLGVRVSNLEKKVGNISWSGNGYMKFYQTYKTDTGDKDDKYVGRIRINVKGQVNDSTYVNGLLRTDMDFKNSDSKGTYMQRLYVRHAFGDKVEATLGKYDQFFGQTGVFFDSEIKGAELAYHANDAANLAVGYGRIEDWSGYADNVTPDHDYAYAQFSGEAGRFAYDVDYVNGTSSNKVNIWGAGLTAGLGGGFDVFGDYYKNTDAKGDPDLWAAGLGYGKQDNAKVGSFRVAASYVDAERNAFLGAYTYDSSPLDAFANEKAVKEVKFWRAEGDVTLAKNVRLHGEYNFDVKTKGTDTDYDDVASVSLNYVF